MTIALDTKIILHNYILFYVWDPHDIYRFPKVHMAKTYYPLENLSILK